MMKLALLLRLLSPVFLVVAALHLALGLGADALLGAAVSPATRLEPSLDSQNRFYGVSFAFYGVALYLCAGDLRRYASILRALFVVFFCAGLARGVSWYLVGAPAPLVMGLLASELALPPLLMVWLSRALREPDSVAST